MCHNWYDSYGCNYVAFVDSDDFVEIFFLEKLYNKTISDNSDVVICDYFAVTPQTVTNDNGKTVTTFWEVSNTGSINKITTPSLLVN